MNNKIPKVTIIIQARMNSSRLPGKVLMEIGGVSMLSCLIRRVKRSKLAQKVVVATTDQSKDDPLVQLCKKEKVNIYRGSENNVLDRMIDAAAFFDADVIVRLTADNPFVGADLIDLILSKFLDLYPNIDYVSNTEKSGFPFGLFVEVVKTSALIKVRDLALSAEQLEHVTWSFRKNRSFYKTCNVTTEMDFGDLSLSIDTLEDYIRLCPIFQRLFKADPNFDLAAIVNLVKLGSRDKWSV